MAAGSPRGCNGARPFKSTDLAEYEEALEYIYAFGGSLRAIPEHIQKDLLDLEYRERFHLSAQEFENEPWEAIWLAHLKWSMQAKAVPVEGGSSSEDDWGFKPPDEETAG